MSVWEEAEPQLGPSETAFPDSSQAVEPNRQQRDEKEKRQMQGRWNGKMAENAVHAVQ